jgi:hypothetical protein
MDFGSLSQAFSMNPFLMGGSGMPNGHMMSQLMGAGLHQGWPGALSGKQLWMKDENKVTVIDFKYFSLNFIEDISFLRHYYF